MLRRNQKEWLGSTTKQLEDERNGIQQRLQNYQSEHNSRESEWEKEKERLNIRIFELEEIVAERKGEGLLAKGVSQAASREGTGRSAVEESIDGVSEVAGGALGKEMNEVMVRNKKLKKKL